MGAAGTLVELETERKLHAPPRAARSGEVARLYGVVADEALALLGGLRVAVGPGRIVALLGPSGSGKSTALAAIAARLPRVCDVGRVEFPSGRTVVDGVVPQADLAAALAILSRCALSEPRLWLRDYRDLSAGEQFRARLARALGMAAERSGPQVLLIDEFAAGLQRRAARALACNLRKLVAGPGPGLVVATVQEDVVADLQPDALVTLSGKGVGRVRERQICPQPFSLAAQLEIVPGSKSDYAAFADMHYRSTPELGFVDKVFVLRERGGGEALGIVVYAHSPAELALRNQATAGRFSGRLDLLNREMRVLRRLVIHPDVRGCGLGRELVRSTLPLVGTRWVECLAAMGAVHPVFERAGMTRIGECALSPRRRKVLERLRALDVDPFAADFEREVGRRPALRELVVDVVAGWYRATAAGGAQRATRQSLGLLVQLFRGLVGTRPVYYLWESPAAALPGDG